MSRSLSSAAASCGLVLSLALAACASAPEPRAGAALTAASPASASVHDTLLLVSLDGFHPRYLDLGITPNLRRIADEGVRARWMTPSYPVLTLPNHYTLVTGLRPDRHGIVHNSMDDDAIGKFRANDPVAADTGAWWGGEPLWVTAEKAGLPTATMFWAGSEAAIGGARPARWRYGRHPRIAPIERIVGRHREHLARR